MPSVVADTHAVLWYLGRDSRLSIAAANALRSAVEGGAPILVASISLVELTYLVVKGRLPAIALQALRDALADPEFGLALAPLDLRVAGALQQIPRGDVPDLPDRVIAATALSMHLPLVTRDGRIRSSGILTIW
ncbi:MAG: type II toxin-antitoxin system VapC family toxin [Bryobacterales bacterium]|nr:type II toxin-antitoxin system VapC family toxin [Bryobacterales bacterium]